MQEQLASVAIKKIFAGKKGKKVQPNAGGGVAEVGDEYGNAVAKKGKKRMRTGSGLKALSWSSWSTRRSGRPRPPSLWWCPMERAEAASLVGENSTARWTCAGCT